jgi:uncharacterized protein (TIGR03643 family)
MEKSRDATLAKHQFAATSDSMSKSPVLTEAQISDVVQMALSDHISFSDIQSQYGLQEKQVKALMRDTLKPGSYKTWRKRVRDFGDRRAHYK